jgi:arsenate reductase
MRRRVLFICTHNSARSQMAEGLLRHDCGEVYDALSAGTEPSKVHPLAIQAMADLGIDISAQRSKPIAQMSGESVDIAVTVCDRAAESCPFFPSAQRTIHQSFEDPSAALGSEEERLAVFQRVRDEIRRWIAGTFPCNGNAAEGGAS